MEERQDKSALGWGKEEKKETETKWWDTIPGCDISQNSKFETNILFV